MEITLKAQQEIKALLEESDRLWSKNQVDAACEIDAEVENIQERGYLADPEEDNS